ncbi:hypothetical protein BJ165DRAFT_1535483 [Panaeolus papilionaceus]|nr:hypothetical protein BJ165DRAFT_1535483 [Panaeolus papilionaceus]
MFPASSTTFPAIFEESEEHILGRWNVAGIVDSSASVNMWTHGDFMTRTSNLHDSMLDFQFASSPSRNEDVMGFSLNFDEVINEIDRLRDTVICSDDNWCVIIGFSINVCPDCFRIPYHIVNDTPRLHLCRNLFQMKRCTSSIRYPVHAPWPIRPDYSKALYDALNEFDLNPAPVFDKNNSLYPAEFLQSRMRNAQLSIDFDLRRVDFPVTFDIGIENPRVPTYLFIIRVMAEGSIEVVQLDSGFDADELFLAYMERYTAALLQGDERLEGADQTPTSFVDASNAHVHASPTSGVSLERVSLKRISPSESEDGPAHSPTAKRMRRTRAAEEKWRQYGHLRRGKAKRSYVFKAVKATTHLRLSDLPMSSTGFTGKSRAHSDHDRIYTVQDLKEMGFTLIEASRCDRPIVDSKGRILAVISPPPPGDYGDSMVKAAESMEKSIETVAHDSGPQRRGASFTAVNVGLTYGPGATKPSRPPTPPVAIRLMEDADIQRLAAYQDATFALWHPKAYSYYKTNLDKLYTHHPELGEPNFSRSILPKVAFNLGRNVWTFKHVDSQNCPFGWCCVTSLGSFDYTQGGHLILWELGIFLEFPAGYCICIPSALITHSNIPVNQEEKRMSFTQYCPGEIFRYIENGFMTDTALLKKDSSAYLRAQDLRQNRVKEGYDKFSCIEHLLDLHN